MNYKRNFIKRGALFMVDLRFYLEDLGYNVVNIKNDSIAFIDIKNLEGKQNGK